MNAISQNPVILSTGLPATTVLRIASDRPFRAPPAANIAADDVLLAAVTYPPRVGEVLPIASLLPDVLARYGLKKASPHCEPADQNTFECYA